MSRVRRTLDRRAIDSGVTMQSDAVRRAIESVGEALPDRTVLLDFGVCAEHELDAITSALGPMHWVDRPILTGDGRRCIRAVSGGSGRVIVRAQGAARPVTAADLAKITGAK